ncbi:FAD binding domain-containing protein [Nocardioides cynanchi]|uniref:FAD binding domain-containing protein n=1 Tax=Nocardioides cynanchi TaxID=2558918 RepID=UPI001246D623|nr:FAD binding domain-containing protein [Nocardioides cynanchi]
MKPAPFAFVRPQGLQHALEALAADEGAKVLAGGQSLVPLLNMRLAAPTTLVDINGLPALDEVLVSDEGVEVPALARQADVLASTAVRRVQPLLGLALAHVAHATIRNRGTVVGSLVHADAAAELPMVLALLGGHLRVASTAGTREIPADELFAGPLESTVRHDEIAVSAFFPALGADEGVAFAELARRHGDYAMCGAGALVRVEGDRVTRAWVAYLSVCDVPTVVDVELDDVGAEALAAAAERALGRLDPVGDVHASADYRAHLARVLTVRVLREAYDDARARAVGGRADPLGGRADPLGGRADPLGGRADPLGGRAESRP